MAEALKDDDFAVLKVRARHRLIGTGMIALALVSVIPMLLNHPRALEREESVSTAPEPVAESPRAKGPEIKLAESHVAPVSETPATPLPALPPSVIPPLETQSKSGPHSVPEEKGASPEKTPDSSGEKVVDKAAKAAPEHASEQSAPTHEDRSTKSTRHERGWFVQIGVFAEEARAQDLKSRFKEKGIDLTADTLKGRHGPMTRLRAGPFEDRAAASALLARAQALQENAILVHQ